MPCHKDCRRLSLCLGSLPPLEVLPCPYTPIPPKPFFPLACEPPPTSKESGRFPFLFLSSPPRIPSNIKKVHSPHTPHIPKVDQGLTSPKLFFSSSLPGTEANFPPRLKQFCSVLRFFIRPFFNLHRPLFPTLPPSTRSNSSLWVPVQNPSLASLANPILILFTISIYFRGFILHSVLQSRGATQNPHFYFSPKISCKTPPLPVVLT